MGGEQTGWALDADVATTRRALEQMPDLLHLVPLDEAEIVHSVWEDPILRLPADRLAGKRIICHVCNEVMRTFEMSIMTRALERIGLWVPISREAEEALNRLRLPQTYMPYTVDTGIFRPVAPGEDARGEARKAWDIPADAYVISNFMRDSKGGDLSRPKPQKGVELFLEIVRTLARRQPRLHVLLAGPRRHWLRARLREAGVPFTYAGREIDGEDNTLNILDPSTIRSLYLASDVHLVTSRWEGGPRAVLEASAVRTRMLCTPVGMAADVLEPACLFRDWEGGLQALERDISTGSLEATIEPNYRRVLAHHVPEANLPILRSIYEGVDRIPTFLAPAAVVAPATRTAARWWRAGVARLTGRSRRPGAGLCIGLWHEFHKPPYGGGNQFMTALSLGLKRAGVKVVTNHLGRGVDVHICNSAWFATDRFDRAARDRKIRMIHRVDGPIGVYRGTDMSEDNRIYALNERYASATVFQSAWCFQRLLQLGYHPRKPVVICNAVDDRIFHDHGRVPRDARKKIRLISTAWSDNPMKGGPFLKRLEGLLDWDRFEYTFVGRTKESFTHIRHIPPQPSGPLADLLRTHDIYIMASRHEACSNALLEALACGLPALYVADGGNGELVGFGGLPFTDESDVLPQLDRLALNHAGYAACRWVPSLDDIALRYIELARQLMEDNP